MLWAKRFRGVGVPTCNWTSCQEVCRQRSTVFSECLYYVYHLYRLIHSLTAKLSLGERARCTCYHRIVPFTPLSCGVATALPRGKQISYTWIREGFWDSAAAMPAYAR